MSTPISSQFLIKVIILPIFWILGCIYIYSSRDSYQFQKLVWMNEASDKVVILFWTTYFGSKNKDPLSAMGIHKGSYPPGCFQNCEFTFNRSRITEAHALVFHSRDLKLSDMPKFRSATQIWVWMEQESPIQVRNDLDLFSGVFNWTMTYRNDSDIVHSYGKVVAIERSEAKLHNESDLNAILSEKKKVSVAVISNCYTNSKRELLIKHLKSEGISIDVFGKCGVSVCPRGTRTGQNCTESEFWKKVSKEYKFYLSFENALCKDYATEKVFRTLELGLVPIVYGGADYNRIAPPNSFINVESFDRLSNFGKFLNHLDRNDEEYRKYFEWRKNYKVVRGDGWCLLCDNVRKQNLKRKEGMHHIPKVYQNLKEWWLHYTVSGERRPACRKPEKFL